jgi:hypothetical protein
MIFIDNKYTKWYYNIILNAKSRNLLTKKDAKNALGYSECHHIIPRSLNGSDAFENKVYLTAREHLICHLLLTKMVTGIGKSKMYFALWAMCMFSVTHKRKLISSKKYEQIKKTRNALLIGIPKSEKHRKALSIYREEKHHGYGKKRPEHSIRMQGENNPMYGIIGTNNPLYGVKRENDVCDKIKNNRWDEQRKLEQSSRLKERRKMEPVLKCPHCGKEGKGPVMKKYHFDRCKSILSFAT